MPMWLIVQQFVALRLCTWILFGLLVPKKNRFFVYEKMSVSQQCLGVATVPVSKAGAVADAACRVGFLLRNYGHGLEPFDSVFLFCFRQPDSCGSMPAVDSLSTSNKLPRLTDLQAMSGLGPLLLWIEDPATGGRRPHVISWGS